MPLPLVYPFHCLLFVLTSQKPTCGAKKCCAVPRPKPKPTPCSSAPLYYPPQVHVWRQEVLHGTLPETQPNPATNGGSAPLLTDGDHKEEGDGKASRPASAEGQQVGGGSGTSLRWQV